VLSMQLSMQSAKHLPFFLRRVESLLLTSQYEKTVALLLHLEEEFGKRAGTRSVITLPLTHQDIASLLGISRERASVQMEALTKKKLIKREGTFVAIENREELEEELE
jgi:CRP/FNR family transcriptional regulator, cyclic AMP receptor protein